MARPASRVRGGRRGRGCGTDHWGYRPMPRFDERHFYLHEIGDLSPDPAAEPLMLVGGVLLLGPCVEADDRHLLDCLKRRLTAVGGRFPRDYHYYDSTLPRGVLDGVL